MDTAQTLRTAECVWEESIIPKLEEYIRIPNKSPQFDPNWDENGYMDAAVNLLHNWADEQDRPDRIQGMGLEVLQLEGRTPLIFIEIEAQGGAGKGTIMLYGHLDKQPEMTGWREGLGPWEPVREGDKLYGRGGADDGYALFASLTAIRLLQEQGLPHARIVILIEASEESGSPDLPAYVEAYAKDIGEVDLVICLDSGCGNYDQLWMTTSLRGVVVFDLRVDILTEGVHSGAASGIVPDSFRILRNLIARIEDHSGFVLIDGLNVDIPEKRSLEAEHVAEVLGWEIIDSFPWVPGGRPMKGISGAELLLRKTWRPALTTTGMGGFPPSLESAGNVLRPYTTARFSMRIPPTLDAMEAERALREALLMNPPYGAKVTFTSIHPASGWHAPLLAPWLEKSVDDASMAFFGKPAMYMGEGGTIPFMGMLGEKFPNAQFLITGVLGPHSNAHGPNEFLHIPMGMKLTASVAKVIFDHASR